MVEGANAVGKSTICKKLVEMLSNSEKIDNIFNGVISTKFPCNLNPRHNLYDLIESQSPRLNEEFAIDRYFWFLQNFPNLEYLENFLVISDRYMSSSFAFNSNGNFGNLQELEYAEYKVLGNPVPTLEFIIDVNPDEAKRRIELRGNELRHNERDWTIQENAYKKYLTYNKIVTTHECFLIKNKNVDTAVMSIFIKILEYLGE
ncbi:MAG: hypothetical protein WBP41_16575 [Saprospiraceae bacterium]